MAPPSPKAAKAATPFRTVLLIWLGWAVLMMGLVFGIGHLVLGGILLLIERQQGTIRLHREVA